MACQENSEIAKSSRFGYFSTSLVAPVLIALALASCGPLCLAQEPAPRSAADLHNAPDWEHAQTTSSGARATLKVSKDNVIFGVRAVDAAGHRSLPVVPKPER